MEDKKFVLCATAINKKYIPVMAKDFKEAVKIVQGGFDNGSIYFDEYDLDTPQIDSSFSEFEEQEFEELVCCGVEYYTREGEFAYSEDDYNNMRGFDVPPVKNPSFGSMKRIIK